MRKKNFSITLWLQVGNVNITERFDDMNIAAYCRVSTDKEDQLNSLEAQKEFFAEYTKRTGNTLVGLYADEGISGTKIKNRKEFLRMMTDAQHGLFDLVVVKDISRFARNTVDLLQNVRKLKSLGIETQFLTANMTSMGNSEFVLTIFGALAQEESANTSKRVKFGKKMNAEKGGFQILSTVMIRQSVIILIFPSTKQKLKPFVRFTNGIWMRAMVRLKLQICSMKAAPKQSETASGVKMPFAVS